MILTIRSLIVPTLRVGGRSDDACASAAAKAIASVTVFIERSLTLASLCACGSLARAVLVLACSARHRVESASGGSDETVAAVARRGKLHRGNNRSQRTSASAG